MTGHTHMHPRSDDDDDDNEGDDGNTNDGDDDNDVAYLLFDCLPHDGIVNLAQIHRPLIGEIEEEESTGLCPHHKQARPLVEVWRRSHDR